MKTKLLGIYRRLYAHFGSQGWWPADNDFEVCVGAVLAQNCAWKNVEKAIEKLKAESALDIHALLNMDESKLARLIRPTGYYNLKTKRLKTLLRFLVSVENSDWRNFLKRTRLEKARKSLLSVHGIGPETADSILLYAANRLTFVVDKYTMRITERYGLLPANTDYEEARDFFMRNLPRSPKLYNEYHALFVALGNRICKTRPLCGECPLKKGCRTAKGYRI